MSDQDEKLTKLTPLRLSPETNRRVLFAAKRRGIKRSDWIRLAIASELVRDEAAAIPAITPEQATWLELCAAAALRGIDPKQALDVALEAAVATDACAPGV